MDFAEFMEEEQASWGACSYLIGLIEKSGLHEREQELLTNELVDGVDWDRWHEISKRTYDALPPEWYNYKGQQGTIIKLLNAIT